MTRKIFVAATGQNSGKTTTSLSLFHLAQKKYGRVGFIKPLGPKPTMLDGITVDKDAALLAQVFGLTNDLRLMSPVVIHPQTTQEVVDGIIATEDLRNRILEATAELEKKCDFLIIEGSGHVGVGSVIGLSNARIARMLGASVLMITGGGLGNVVDSVQMNLALLQRERVDVRAIMANKLLPKKREKTLDYLRRALDGEEFEVLAGFDYQPVLANPTLRRIANLLDLPIHGDRSEEHKIIHHVQIGAASTQRVAELLKPASLLIVTSSRDELLVTLANMYNIPEYRPKIVGLVIPGIIPIGRITQQILDRSEIPYLRTQSYTTAELHRIITEDVSKLTAEDTEKLDLVRSLAESSFDFDRLDRLFDPR